MYHYKNKGLRFIYLQNNKALKRIRVYFPRKNCFIYLQNNKALKHQPTMILKSMCFIYLQNNKALKPQTSNWGVKARIDGAAVL